MSLFNKLDKRFLYLKIIYFIRYFGDALFYGFTSLYLANAGFKEGIIGNIQAITTITALLVNPLWSIAFKNNKVARRIMIFLSIIEGALIIVYGNFTTIEIIMILTALLAMVASPFYTALDGYAATYCNQNNKEFPSVRVIGSLAYTVATLASGFLIDKFGFTIVFILAGIIFITTGILTCFLRDLVVIDTTGKEVKRSYKGIFTNKWFIIYLISYILIVSVSVLGDNYVSLYFTKQQGLSITSYSYVSTAILICEVISILLLTKFAKNVRLEYLFILAGLIYFLKSFILSFVSLPLFLLTPAACLRGLAWGLVLYTHMKYLIKLVGLENVTTAALLVSVCGSVITFILSNGIGYLIEEVGYSLVFLIISLIVLGATIMNICLIFFKNKAKNNIIV